MAYLAVDLGTTGCRSAVFGENFNMLAYDYEEYGLITPQENYVEQDAELWWKLTVKTAKEAIGKSGISPCDIRSICISSQGITLVPVDDKINPLSNALSWLDTRAYEEAEEIEKDMGFENMHQLTGKRIDSVYTLPKILWLKKHRHEIYEKAYKLLMPLDFLIAKLTGNCITDHSMASGTLMYDVENRCWSKKILSNYGIDEKKLPDISYSGKSAGRLLPEASKQLGLENDCIVAVGGQDQKCAAYGAGLDEETVTVSLGTAAAITKIFEESSSALNSGLGRCGYVKPDFLVTEGVINTAGTCLRWIRDMLFKGEDYEIINAEAEESLKNGSNVLFYPYLNGASSPFFYKESTGCFYGMSLATTRGNFALSVMEGVAFQIRTLLEAMGNYKEIKNLILFGGGANGKVWPQIIADVTGVQVKIPETTQVASVGAALLAAKASGHKETDISCKSVFTPTSMKEEYNKKYKKYREIERTLWEEEKA